MQALEAVRAIGVVDDDWQLAELSREQTACAIPADGLDRIQSTTRME